MKSIQPSHAWGMIYAAWFLFWLSMMLPATVRMRGWEAALNSLWVLFPGGLFLAVVDFPLFFILLFSLLFNIAMAIAPWTVAHNPGRASKVAACLAPAAIVPWILPDRYVLEPRIGFYVWMASFALMACGCWLLEQIVESDDAGTDFREAYRSRSRP